MKFTFRKNIQIVKNISLQFLSSWFISFNKNKFNIEKYTRNYFDIIIGSDKSLFKKQIKKIKNSKFKEKYKFRIWVLNFNDPILISDLIKEIEIRQIILCIEDYVLIKGNLNYLSFVKNLKQTIQNESEIILLMPLDMKIYSLFNPKSRLLLKEIGNIVKIEYLHYIRYFKRRLTKNSLHCFKRDKKFYYYQTVQNLLHQIMSTLETQYTMLGISFYNINKGRQLRKAIKAKYSRKSQAMYKELLYKSTAVSSDITKKLFEAYKSNDFRRFYINDYCIVPRRQLNLSRQIISKSLATFYELDQLN